jgi:hypothetical protein
MALRYERQLRLPSTSPLAKSEGEEKELGDDGRRPTSRAWRRRDAGASRRASRSEAEGTPKGLARPRSAGGSEEPPVGS